MRRWLCTGLFDRRSTNLSLAAPENTHLVWATKMGDASRIDCSHGVRIFSRWYGGTGAPPPWIEAVVESVEFGMHAFGFQVTVTKPWLREHRRRYYRHRIRHLCRCTCAAARQQLLLVRRFGAGASLQSRCCSVEYLGACP